MDDRHVRVHRGSTRRLGWPLGLCALLATPAAAQSWVSVGPFGGDVRALAADPRDPRIVYLGTADGVLYRSENAGRLWSRSRPGFPKAGMSLDNVIVDPRGNVLVGYWEVAGAGGGVARSSDGGRSFTVLQGIAGESVRALAIAPTDDRILVAGTLSGVFRSVDGGASWDRVSPAGHPEIRNVESVAIDPRDPNVVYAGTWHLPWKTLDGGRTWRRIHAGMIDDSDVFTLTVDRRSPRTVYATACSGIFRSQDAGGRWTKVRGIPPSSRRTRAFAQDPERLQAFYAGTTEGLWASEDDALSWRRLTPGDLVVNAVLVQPGGNVLLGTDGAGVLRSVDRGETWSDSNEGFSGRFVSRVLFDRTGSRILAAVLSDRAHGGIFAAPGPEGPWTRLGAGLERREVLSLERTASGVLAGTDDGLFEWDSSCGCWTRIATLLDGMELHPRVSGVQALTEQLFLLATDRGLLRTTDRGATWSRQTLGTSHVVLALAKAPRESGLVMAATPLGVFRSQDAGATWSAVSSAPGHGRIRSLEFLPGGAQVLFATTPDGLYRSDDQGRTWWTGGGMPAEDVVGLAIDGSGRTLYASAFDGGLFRSEDAGVSWSTLPTEGLPTDRVWAVAVDPESPGRLIAATPAGGLHVFSARPAPLNTQQ
jgi:photosystem II stability/assembly factor-like uncharacterized protein